MDKKKFNPNSKKNKELSKKVASMFNGLSISLEKDGTVKIDIIK